MTAIHSRPQREKANGTREHAPAKKRGDNVAVTPAPSAVEGPTIADIWHARDVLRGHVGETPMLHSRTFSAMTGADVYLKAENLQRSGSFKLRGATYKIAQLSEEERQHGVIAASAGNHAQGVAIAAHSLGIPCTIVMPEGAPLAKLTATQGYGATVVLHGKTYDDAYIHAREIQDETGAIFIHAFDDPAVIAGQGTLGLEILTEMPDANVIIVPIGGGGLISGVAIAAKSLCPDVQIIGVQAAGANATQRSIEAGKIVTLPALNTIADGISTKRPGDVTFSIIQRYVDQVVSVNDEETASAILLLLERGKLLVEGAGAVGIAALLKPGLLDVAGKKVVVLLSGGNIDMNLIGRFIEYGLSAQGRTLILNTLLVDRPGELLRLLEIIAEMGVNVREVHHRRAVPQMPIQQVEVTMTLETRNRPHAERVLATLHDHGYRVAEVSSCYDDEDQAGG
jgi:threonine dehydratase